MTDKVNESAFLQGADTCGDLRARIARIAATYRKGALPILTSELHGLQRAARASRFDAVAILAHSLEADLAVNGQAAMVGAYMDRMDDAIACADMGMAAVDAMLATIGARLTV